MERQVLRRGTWSKVQACSRRTFHRSVISSAFGLLLVTVSASYLTPMLVTQVCGPGRILVLYYLPWLEVYQIRTFNMYVWTYIHVCDMHMKYMVTRVWNYGSISVLNKRHLMLIITILILFHRCFVSIARTKVAYLFLVLYNLKKKRLFYVFIWGHNGTLVSLLPWKPTSKLTKLNKCIDSNIIMWRWCYSWSLNEYFESFISPLFSLFLRK